MAGIVPRGAEVPEYDRRNEGLNMLYRMTIEFLVGMLNALVGWESAHLDRRPFFRGPPSRMVDYYLSDEERPLQDMAPTATTLLQRFSFVCPPADPVRTIYNRWDGMYATDTFSFWTVIQVKLDRRNRIHRHLLRLFQEAFVTQAGENAPLFLGNRYMLIFFFRTQEGTVVRYVREYMPMAARQPIPNHPGYFAHPLPSPDISPRTNLQQVIVLYRLDSDADALSLLNHPQGPNHRLLPLRPLSVPAYRPERIIPPSI